ncbi:MAG: hypothetical protein PHR56_05165 [Dehalococcoidales bacterium]|nr:hypothetical protein [Dehalococcoidales bacterium]
MPYMIGIIVIGVGIIAVAIAAVVFLLLKRRRQGQPGEYWEVIGQGPEFAGVPGWVKKYCTQSSLMGDLVNNAEYLLLHGRDCDYRVIAAGQSGQEVVVQRRKR